MSDENEKRSITNTSVALSLVISVTNLESAATLQMPQNEDKTGQNEASGPDTVGDPEQEESGNAPVPVLVERQSSEYPYLISLTPLVSNAKNEEANVSRSSHFPPVDENSEEDAEQAETTEAAGASLSQDDTIQSVKTTLSRNVSTPSEQQVNVQSELNEKDKLNVTTDDDNNPSELIEDTKGERGGSILNSMAFFMTGRGSQKKNKSKLSLHDISVQTSDVKLNRSSSTLVALSQAVEALKEARDQIAQLRNELMHHEMKSEATSTSELLEEESSLLHSNASISDVIITENVSELHHSKPESVETIFHDQSNMFGESSIKHEESHLTEEPEYLKTAESDKPAQHPADTVSALTQTRVSEQLESSTSTEALTQTRVSQSQTVDEQESPTTTEALTQTRVFQSQAVDQLDSATTTESDEGIVLKEKQKLGESPQSPVVSANKIGSQSSLSHTEVVPEPEQESFDIQLIVEKEVVASDNTREETNNKKKRSDDSEIISENEVAAVVEGKTSLPIFDQIVEEDRALCPKCRVFEVFLDDKNMKNDEKIRDSFERHMDYHASKANRKIRELLKMVENVSENESASDSRLQFPLPAAPPPTTINFSPETARVHQQKYELLHFTDQGRSSKDDNQSGVKRYSKDDTGMKMKTRRPSPSTANNGESWKLEENRLLKHQSRSRLHTSSRSSSNDYSFNERVPRYRHHHQQDSLGNGSSEEVVIKSKYLGHGRNEHHHQKRQKARKESCDDDPSSSGSEWKECKSAQRYYCCENKREWEDLTASVCRCGMDYRCHCRKSKKVIRPSTAVANCCRCMNDVMNGSNDCSYGYGYGMNNNRRCYSAEGKTYHSFYLHNNPHVYCLCKDYSDEEAYGSSDSEPRPNNVITGMINSLNNHDHLNNHKAAQRGNERNSTAESFNHSGPRIVREAEAGKSIKSNTEEIEGEKVIREIKSPKPSTVTPTAQAASTSAPARNSGISGDDNILDVMTQFIVRQDKKDNYSPANQKKSAALNTQQEKSQGVPKDPSLHNNAKSNQNSRQFSNPPTTVNSKLRGKAAEEKSNPSRGSSNLSREDSDAQGFVVDALTAFCKEYLKDKQSENTAQAAEQICSAVKELHNKVKKESSGVNNGNQHQNNKRPISYFCPMYRTINQSPPAACCPQSYLCRPQSPETITIQQDPRTNAYTWTNTPLQEVFKRYHSVCYNRMEMRQRSITNLRRHREAKQEEAEAQFMKKFAKCSSSGRRSSSRPGTPQQKRTSSGGSRNNATKHKRTDITTTTTVDQNACEVFTYVVPKCNVYWQSL